MSETFPRQAIVEGIHAGLFEILITPESKGELDVTFTGFATYFLPNYNICF